MSSPEVCSGPEGVGVALGFQTETPSPRDGPEKVAVVPKSISLQEMRRRPSFKDNSECDITGELINSSGVFTCSVDISDVCMADLTKLSDSTVCSSSESINKSTLQPSGELMTPLLSSAAMSTPLALYPNTSDVLTPMRSQSDFLSPQFGANDDYLRRNIKFIYKQLWSLMTQLRTEDKYFLACAQRYEEVIANLEGEIDALKSTKSATFNNLDEQPATTEIQQHIDKSFQTAQEPANDQDLKSILEMIAQHLLPKLRSMVQRASANLPATTGKLWECEADTKQENFKTLTTVFDKCLAQLDIILKASTETHLLSSEFHVNSNQMENAKFTDSGTESLSSYHEDSCIKNKMIDLEINDSEVEHLTDSLRSKYTHTRSSQTMPDYHLQPLCNPADNGESSPNKQISLSTKQQVSFELVEDTDTETFGETDVKIRQGEQYHESLTDEHISNKIHSEQGVVDRRNTAMVDELYRTKEELDRFVVENAGLKETICSNGMEIAKLVEKIRDLETGHKIVVDELRIEGSRLILENSKLKEELRKLHEAVDDAHLYAKNMSEKFDNLQKLYDALKIRIDTKEEEFSSLEIQRKHLDALLKTKDSVLVRLCSNFNELLAIFRECQDLGLDRDSSATDIDNGFFRLKRRLLDLSQDYITLNNRNKVLEKDVTSIAANLKEKEHEVSALKRAYDNKCEKLQRTLEKLEGENKELVSEKIQQEDALKKMKSKLADLESQGVKGCQECAIVRNRMQQLQIDLVDKDATISTLELHIQSCCDHNRKKAQHYKHELHALKRQMDAQGSYAVDFCRSPRKSKTLSPKVDVGVQFGESFLHHHTGGFVERFKIRELEDKVIKLEKERTVLKRLCKVRSDRIHELESQLPPPHVSK